MSRKSDSYLNDLLDPCSANMDGASVMTGQPFLQCMTERFKQRRIARLLQIKIDQETKLMGECTFHPELCAESLSHFTSPAVLESRRISRIARTRAEATKELTYKPKLINSIKRSTNVPVHERLYSLASIKGEPFDTPRSAASSFELMLGQNAGLKLYTDACQRQVRRSATEADLVTTARRAATPKITNTTAHILSSAIEKEARELLGSTTYLSRDSFFQILKSLGFAITDDSSVQEAWRFVNYDFSGAVSADAFITFITSLHSDNSLAQKFRSLLDTRRFRKTLKKPAELDENMRPPRITEKSARIVEKIRARSPLKSQKILSGDLLVQLRKQADDGFVTPPSPSEASECTFQPTLLRRRIPPIQPAVVCGFEKAAYRLRSSHKN